MSVADDKPEQESFLAQLNEVAEIPTQCQPVVLHEITPSFDPAPVVSTYVPEAPVPAVPIPLTDTVNDNIPANGNSSSQLQTESHSHEQDSPNKEANPASAPQAVTGNVKIQLMEISVEEFKSNVEYIQTQFASMPRRLICDAFSKANFDCRAAIELLTKEQEKKDQSIVPPLLLAARQQQQQQQQQLQQLHQHYQKQQQQPKQQSAQKSATKAAQQPPATPETPTSAAQQQPSSTPTLPLPRGGRRSRASQSPKEDLCYKRVAIVDKEAERTLRQKLKSNVRSRVFNHGARIGQGRDSASNALQRRRSGLAGSAHDADSSVDASIIDDEDSSAPLADPASAGAAAASAANSQPAADVDVDAEPGSPAEAAPAAVTAEEEELASVDPSEPQSAMRILRDSFPGLSEPRIAECLAECNQDVDETIRVLSGRRLESGGGGPGGGGDSARFFKSKQMAGKVQQARKDYVRAELNSGAWMGRQAAATAAAASRSSAAAPAASTLRVYTVPQKRRLTETARYQKGTD